MLGLLLLKLLALLEDLLLNQDYVLPHTLFLTSASEKRGGKRQ